MNHTPGPWKLLEVRGQRFIAAKPYEGHPYYGINITIEVLSIEDYPTKEGDMILCGAAPDMLQALKDALVAMVYAQDIPKSHPALRSVREALMKAEARYE